MQRGLLLGYYKNAKDESFKLQNTCISQTEQETFLLEHLAATNASGAFLETRIVSHASGHIALVGLGDAQKYSQTKTQDPMAENGSECVRRAISAGIQKLVSQGVTHISVDNFGNAQAAAEGAFLSTFKFKKFQKTKQLEVPEVLENENMPFVPEISVSNNTNDPEVAAAWNKGVVLSQAQNIARELAEMPPNYLTPNAFCQKAEDIFADGHHPNVRLIVRDLAWIKKQSMLAFMSVAKGSEEEARFLEIIYEPPRQTAASNGGSQPLVLVGKGITFDSGGISIKPSRNMSAMKGDMGGAAAVVGAIFAASKLAFDASVIGLIPLCENMPSGKAAKPGDVVRARNGLFVEIINTDAEGRLILADALSYGIEVHKPHTIVDIATLTGAIDVAIGPCAAGLFTPSDEIFQTLASCSASSGEWLWRMPLWSAYAEALKSSVADVKNCTEGGQGGSCTAAAFLHKFVDAPCNWAHLDIASVMEHKNDTQSYLPKGMSGFGARLLATFIESIANKNK